MISFIIRLFLFALAVACCSLNGFGQDEPALTWFRTEVPEGTASAWYRWAVDPSVENSDTAELTIVTNGHCSLYVNGQRMLKNASMPQTANKVEASGRNVKPLLRHGRNTVAVEVHAADRTAVFGIAIQAVDGASKKSIGGGWKRAPIVPPVGWQQTDFNDRDWPEARPVADEPGNRFMVVAPNEFTAPAAPAKKRPAPFQFEDGDHVVFAGATFFERAQLSEHLETTLTGTLGSKHVTFRNLGWSADTVFADSRGIFDRPDVGYLRMVEHIRAEEPTIAFICYGQNEALTPGMTPDQYAGQLGKLLDELAASGITCILVSPHELFPATPPIPSPARFNPRIKVFSEAMSSVAQSRGLLFVDMFTDFSKRMLETDAEIRKTAGAGNSDVYQSLADNGMHLTDHGYRCAARIFTERLLGSNSGIEAESPSRYEARRQLIRKKNELYFHRWRPQNITYLFGFRKHEQGNNAADIAKFDPFILALEKQIYELQ
ncbi:MAG: GDSL-type esterase/lipase family protein [Planctomycetaceae bacterium]